MHLPVAARVYVGAVIVLGAAIVAGLPSLQFPHPSLFAGLFALSVISSALKVDLPVGWAAPASRLRRRLHRAPAAWAGADGAHRDRERLVAVLVPDEAAQPGLQNHLQHGCLAVTVAATARVYTVLGGTRAARRRCRR